MLPRPNSLLIDDVDLLLGELTDRVRLRGDESPELFPWPRSLLVATPERALSPDASAPGGYITISVANGDSAFLQSRFELHRPRETLIGAGFAALGGS